MLNSRQAYDKCLSTFISWVNWKNKSDVGGLLLGLGDYYIEIRILEDELNIPIEERFDLDKVLDWK
jgi:hypothetical protein